MNLEIGMEAHFPTRPRHRRKRSTEVGWCLKDLLSFHPHVTVALVDCSRIQFYHANHSAVLVSSVIDLSLHNDEGGIDRLIAILIAFRRLSLHDQTVHDAGQNGMALRLGGNDKVEGPIDIELGVGISMTPSLVGRSTAVMHGTSSKWPKSRLVVKVSWVDDSRIPEHEFMDKAVEEARKPGHEWALNHLPRFFYVEDINDQTDRSVQELFKAARFANKEYAYEKRQMRIMVQECLHRLKTLANVNDIGQVMLDVTCGGCPPPLPSPISRLLSTHTGLVHRWLYDNPRILHRDLSLSNIMYRTIEGKVHGVLTDYDFSSWKACLAADCAKTSQLIIGTTLFMARGLLDGTDTVHLYRHDVEALFYAMVILATHYEVQAPKEGEDEGLRARQGLQKLPYQARLDEPSCTTLAAIKHDFIWNSQSLDLSPTFEDFRGWLTRLRRSFSRGSVARSRILLQTDPEESCDKDAPAIFDDETLGGHLNYSSLIDPVRDLKGKLEGLVIRYDPQPPSPPTVGAQADA